ncbi:MAG: hypothetical protein Fur0037_28590 [Planctomycetota bacterium]
MGRPRRARGSADRFRKRRAADERGFTLVEMMVALAILLVGITSLLGALTGGIEMRRSSEAETEAALAADRVFAEVVEGVRLAPDARTALDLIYPSIENRPCGTLPGMSCSVRYENDPDRPDLVLAVVEVSWKEQGEDVRREFARILQRQEPLGLRVARFLRQNGRTDEVSK